MKFFIVSQNGDAGGVATQLQKEGHEVCMYFKNSAARQSLKGIVPSVSSMRLGLNESPDVVIFDMVGMGREADKLKESGYRVLGGGAWNDKLELDRKFSMKTMDVMGIRAPRSFAFPNMKAAMEFAEGHNKLLVLKPFDNRNTAFTFVPKTQDQLLNYMKHLKVERGVDGKILLQEYVDGTEISTEIWYALGQPVPMPNSTLETKKFMPGDVGVSTGASTSVVFNYPKREPKIIQQSLKKLSLFLERIRYTGPLDINGIVRNGRFYGLEFSPRLGFNAIYAWMRTLDEPLSDVLIRLVEGKPDPIKVKPGYGYVMRVSIPPYPFYPEDKSLRRKIFSETKNQRIAGLGKSEMEKFYPLDMWKKGEEYYTAGVDGCVGEITGFGEDLFSAEREALEAFRKLQLPNKQARLGDILRNAEQRLFELNKQGYEVPPFEMPGMPVETLVPEIPVKVVEVKKNETKTSNVGIAAKLGVRPGAMADPAVKSN